MLQVDKIIAPTMPGLPYLQELELSNMHWEQFSKDLAEALHSLSLLDLSGEDLSQLPPAISQITTLQILKLSSPTSSLLLQYS
jgi:Leucine-rich repeat (LRR) protein